MPACNEEMTNKEIAVVISHLLLPLREQYTPLKCFRRARLMLSLTCFLFSVTVHVLYSINKCAYTYTQMYIEEWSSDDVLNE